MAAAAAATSFVGVRKSSFVNASRFGIGASKPRFGFRVRRSPRCEIGANLEDKAKSRASSISALEQFKVSGTDRYMKERSSIAVIGLSVHTTPVEMREKLAIPEALWPRAIGELCNLNHIEEAAVLSTCNRMEIYVVALSWHRGIREVIDWMSKTSGIPVPELREHLFMLRDSDATRHLFEVSAGLDSLVLGEGQILAQVKQVVRVGQGSGGLGKNIDRLFKDAITAGKRVRSETNISSGAVSVSSAAVELALMKLPKSHALIARMLVIGAGKMGKLVIKHLASKGCRKIVVVNRSTEKVDAMREELKDVEIIYKPLDEMLSSAAEADVVFTSTASETPLFFKGNVESLPPVGEDVGGVRFFVDISVPRNVGSCVSELKLARTYNVDDLKEVVEANKEDRLRKAMEAQAIITQELKRFEAWRDSLETVPTIKKLRSYADRIKVAEIEKCCQKIGEEALTKKMKRAIEDLSNGIVNKLLHGPLQHLRCDGSDSRTLDETLENMHALNRMFDLDTDKSIIEQKIKAKGTLPFRLLAAEYGADITYGEEIIDHKMIKCERRVNESLGSIDFVEKGTKNVVFRTCDEEKDRVVFQMGTSDAVRALNAAQIVCKDVAAIDINMGCPKSFSLSGGMGAALLSKPELIHDILTTLRRNLQTPVTCKIRLLNSSRDTVELAQKIERTGVHALAVHGRRVKDRPRDPANWSEIADVVASLSIPVIANGDVFEYEDFERIRGATGATSVMVARGALWNTSVFCAKGKSSWVDVKREYVRKSILWDNDIKSTKHTLREMITHYTSLELSEGKAVIKSETSADLAKLYGEEEYYELVNATRL